MIITAMKKRLFLGFLLLSLGMLPTLAQTPTTQGKDFWVSFMRNGYNSNSSSYNHFTLIASAKRACTVTVQNPITGWQDFFNVSGNQVSTYNVDPSQGYNSQMGGKANKGLFIHSSDTISLYIANEAENSYDAANVLPAQALGTQYMIQSYKTLGEQSSHPGDNRASFLVLATVDNTEVQIVPSCETYDNHIAGRPYTISLNRGECYHVLNKNAGTQLNNDGDFSGTTVVSLHENPIAVFNGNSITSIPGGLSTGYDHIFEQAMPTDYWGKEFVVTSTKCPAYMGLLPDQIKVTALFDNTTVTRDGQPLFTLNSGETNSFEMNLVSDPCTRIAADNPIAVFLYQHSHGDGTPNYGDPSMVWISPVEQTVYEVTFSTFSVQQVSVHYVNIVCHTENVAEMTLDGQNIASEFSVVPGDPEFSYTRLQVQHAAHTLRCTGGFIAHVYGIGQAEGYAYSVGSSARTLTNQLLVNGNPVIDEYVTCQSEVLDFRMETNYEPDLITWNYGDDSPEEHGVEVSHAYEKSGHFTVMAVVDHVVNGEPQSDTLMGTIHVNPIKEYDMAPLTTCGTTYTFHGVSYDVPGNYDVHFESSSGCDSVVHIHLIQGNETVYLMDPVVECEHYEWHGLTFTETNHHFEYRVPDATPEGCDSLYILDVTIGEPHPDEEEFKYSCDPTYYLGHHFNQTSSWDTTYWVNGCSYTHTVHFILNHFYDTVTDACDHYEWFGQDLTAPGDYSTDITVGGVCQRHFLHLVLGQGPPFERIVGLNNVAVATNFWPGEYVYRLDDSTGMDTSKITWELENNPVGPGQWEIRPHGASCTLVAYSRGMRRLVVRSGDSHCDKVSYYEINCTGYAVDEQEAVPLEVFPNPAQDAIMVKGPKMEEVVLYNLLGQQVRAVAVQGDAEVSVSVGDLPQALYLLEIRTKYGNNTRLVSVIK